ncbi:MAG: acyltransferase [Spirochaetota bacterium]
MKLRILQLLALPIRLYLQGSTSIRWYCRRIFYYAFASAQIKNLSASVIFDGKINVIGGSQIHIGQQTRIGEAVEFEANDNATIAIRNNVRINRGTTIVAYDTIDIGEKTLIGEFVSIRDANHGIRKGEWIKDQAHNSKAISIGKGVWIGRGACILAGVTLADGCVIAANSVVTKDVAENTIVGGVPAKVIKERV